MTNSLLGHIVTFDQLRNPSLLDLVTPGHEVFKGDNVVAGHIDTAMFVVDRGIIGDHRFQEDVTWGDFLFKEKRFYKTTLISIYTSLRLLHTTIILDKGNSTQLSWYEQRDVMLMHNHCQKPRMFWIMHSTVTSLSFSWRCLGTPCSFLILEVQALVSQ